MIVRHTLTIEAKCPVNGDTDSYECEVVVDRTLPVECILAAAELMKGKTAFQEEITTTLAQELNARVRTVGVHSGVRTEVEAP